jgi:putative hydrolase of the HAD superfamily
MSSRLQGIEAIGFDLDNTLFDRDAAVRGWLSRIFPGEEALVREALEVDNSGFLPRREFYGWLVSRLEWAEDWREVEAHYQREALPLIAEDESIHRAVEALSARYPLAVLTNGGGFQRRKLARLRLSACFGAERVLVTGEIGHDKPDARAFERLAAVLGTAPQRILFVGDNPVNDVEGAAEFGMKTCWVRLKDHHECRVPPDLVVRSVAELPALLQAIPPQDSRASSPGPEFAENPALHGGVNDGDGR